MNGKMEELGDDGLVELAKKGSLDAFAELARRSQEKVYHTIFGMTRNHQDADDLTQETFLYAYRALEGFKQKSSFYTWVYRIAVNLTLNYFKKKGQEKGRQDFEDNASASGKTASTDLSPEGNSLKNELREKLDEAIASLPLAYRAAFNLVVFQGMSHGQAAEILGCSESTVSWRMHKARKMLQDRLQPYFSRGPS
jgi:RNA polymerase sigma-70 factor (ECF subfamily)